MKTLRLFLIVLTGAIFIIRPSSVRPEAREVTIPFTRTVGQQYKLTIRKTVNRSRPGRTNFSSTTLTPVTIKVVGASASGYILEWTIGETRFKNASANSNSQELARALAKEIKGLVVRFSTDRAGSAKQILNKDVVTRAYRRMLGKTYAWALKRDLVKNAKQFRALFPPGTFSPTGIQDQILEDYNLLNQPLGSVVRVDAAIKRKANLPSAFPGKTLPAVITSSATAYDAKAGLIKYRIRIDYDNAVLTRLSLEKIKDAYRVLGKPFPKDFKFPTSTLVQTFDFKIHLKRGFVSRMTHVKTIRAGASLRENITEIILEPPSI